MRVFSTSDIANSKDRFRKNLINSLHGFKSANLVGTQNSTGSTNLALFTQVFHLGATPPLVGMIVRPHEVPRHTLENILATHSYTLNHIQEQFFVEAHHTSARWEGSEFEGVGLSAVYSDQVKAPYVAESAVQIGMEYREHQTLKINNTVLVVGEVIEIRVPDGIVAEDGYLDLEAAGTITATGLDGYHTTEALGRLTYAKPTHKPERLV
ncbi:MAG TPA: flavin oxidoreductase [Cytophagales bacterium]|nr:flavin oxidoreductase [Cytophagales bacterium]HAA22042.1 flavin oxidoreductase [Cytophagales bacterium]HAP58587.1 flavin oxidoreductase [Cytophagales bacterium]